MYSKLKSKFRALLKIIRGWIDFFVRKGKGRPILIYSMGKVASSSIRESLLAYWPGLVINSHTLGENKIDVRYLVRNYLPQGKPLYIISLVREPISRNVSAFFQNYQRETGKKFSEDQFSTTELIDLFVDKYPHQIPLEWFDKNIKDNFNIDVYQHQFPAAGFIEIHEPPVDLLILKSELDDLAKEKAIREFLALDTFSILLSNLSKDKEYYRAYRQFTDAFIPSRTYIEQMYGSKYYQHFYGSTPAEENGQTAE